MPRGDADGSRLAKVVDLHESNHSKLLFPSVARYEEARTAYCRDLVGKHAAVRDEATGRELRVADQRVYVAPAIDARAAGLQSRDDASLRNTKADTPLAAQGPRLDMGGMLYWPEDGASLFRSALTHERLVPYFTELLGEGYRLE